jgi:hypothetical protein
MSPFTKILIQHAFCALVFFMSALVCALIIFGVFQKADWKVMIFAAPLSAAVIGLVAWALITSFGRSVKIWKGIAVGALAGSISHFFAWYSSIVVLYLQGTVTSLDEPTIGPGFEGIWTSLVLTLFSLAFAGWITIPVGGAVGALIAALSQKFLTDNRLS